MKAALRLLLISAGLGLVVDTSRAATSVAVSGIPQVSSLGTNDLVVIDTYNGTTNYTTHTITWSNLQRYIDLSVSTFSNKLAASFVATLKGGATNTILRDANAASWLVITNRSVVGAGATNLALYFTGATNDPEIIFDNPAGKTANIFWFSNHRGEGDYSEPELILGSANSIASGYCQHNWQTGQSSPPAARHWQHGIGGNHLEYEYYQANDNSGGQYNATTNLGTSLPISFHCVYYSNGVQHVVGVPDARNNGYSYPTLQMAALDTNGNGALIFSDYFDVSAANDNRQYVGNTAGGSLERVRFRVGPNGGLDVFGTANITNIDVGTATSSTNVWLWDAVQKLEVHNQPTQFRKPLTVISGSTEVLNVDPVTPTVRFGQSVDTDFYFKDGQSGGSHLYLRHGQYGNWFNKGGLILAYDIDLQPDIPSAPAFTGLTLGTNAASAWPAQALTYGGASLVNSNGSLYLFSSSPGSRSWSKTNLLSQGNFVSAETTVTNTGGALLDTAHSLAGTPSSVRYVLVCKTTDLGFSAGDEVDGASVTCDSGGATGTAWANTVGNANNVVLVALPATPTLINRSNGLRQSVTLANWKFKIYARL